jgi:hypothetical protein
VVARIAAAAATRLRRGQRAEVLQGSRWYQAIVQDVATAPVNSADVPVVLGIVERARPNPQEGVRVRLLTN